MTRKYNMKNKFKILVELLFIASIGWCFNISSVHAVQDLSACGLELNFLVNNKPITNTTILLSSKDTYKVSYKIIQNAGCEPNYYWKLSLQQYTKSIDQYEPKDMPVGVQIDSNVVQSKFNMSNIKSLTKPVLGYYTYTLFVSSDRYFSDYKVLFSKQLAIKFTNDPKEIIKTPSETTVINGNPVPNTAGIPVNNTNYAGKDWDGTLSILKPLKINGQEATDISQVASKLINWLLLIISLVTTIMIIYAGVLLVFNGGNESQFKKAKTILTWAIIGLVVSLSAFAIVNIIQSLLG